MEKRKSNLLKKFAFSLKTSKLLENPIADIQKNTNFYFDLEDKCHSIKKNKKNLLSIKNKLIPELVYTNKDVPLTWKKKPDFQDNVVNIMANNEYFLSYIGKEGLKTEPNITPKKTNDNNNCTPFISYMNKTSRKNTLKQNNSTKGIKKANLWSQYNQNKLNEKEIKIILDDFKTNFPLNDSSNIASGKQNLTARTISTPVNYDIKKMPMKMRLRRKNAFIKSIYNNMIPPKISSKSSKNIIKQNNSYNNKNNQKLEIEDPEIKRKLETINYYGPYYSYCPPCKRRNIDFYNNYEKSYCLRLLQYMKKVRGKIYIDKKLNSKI